MENNQKPKLLVTINDINRILNDKECSVDQLAHALSQYQLQQLKDQQRGTEDIEHEVISTPVSDEIGQRKSSPLLAKFNKPKYTEDAKD